MRLSHFFRVLLPLGGGALLSACSGTDSLLSSVRNERPPQVVSGVRRAPALNPRADEWPPASVTLRAQAAVQSAQPEEASAAPRTNLRTASGAPVQLAARGADEMKPPATATAPATAPASGDFFSRVGHFLRSGSEGPPAYWDTPQPNANDVSAPERDSAYEQRRPLPGNPDTQPVEETVAPVESPPEAIPASVEKPAVKKQPRKKKKRKPRRTKSAQVKKAAVVAQGDASDAKADFPKLKDVPPTPPALAEAKQESAKREQELKDAQVKAEVEKKALEGAPFESIQPPAPPPAPAPAPAAPPTPPLLPPAAPAPVSPVTPPPVPTAAPASTPKMEAPALPLPPAPQPVIPPPAAAVPAPAAPAASPATDSSKQDTAPALPLPPPPPPPPGALLENHPAALAALMPAAASNVAWTPSIAMQPQAFAGRLPESRYVARSIAVSAHMGID